MFIATGNIPVFNSSCTEEFQVFFNFIKHHGKLFFTITDGLRRSGQFLVNFRVIVM